MLTMTPELKAELTAQIEAIQEGNKRIVDLIPSYLEQPDVLTQLTKAISINQATIASLETRLATIK